jgi:hypothetical protein
MLDAIILGKLYVQPKTLVGKSGKPFVVCKLELPNLIFDTEAQP